MKDYKKILVPLLLCCLPLVAGLVLYSKLPAQIPTHFNFAGEADNYSSKNFALFVLPSIMVLLELVMPLLLHSDPKYKNMSPALVTLSLWIVPVIAVVMQAIVLMRALGYGVDINRIMFLLLGLMFVCVGNYLPKTKQSYTMGIKLPWTLNSEENWDRTHRLAGYIWVVCGLVILLGIFIHYNQYIIMICVFTAVIVPTVYSYLLYRKGI